MNPALMTIADAARELGVSESQVRRMITEQHLEAIPGLNRHKKIRRESLDRLIYGEDRPAADERPLLRAM